VLPSENARQILSRAFSKMRIDALTKKAEVLRDAGRPGNPDLIAGERQAGFAQATQ
jgi:hypothetical protein